MQATVAVRELSQPSGDEGSEAVPRGLQELQRGLTLSSLREVIRLLESERFPELTCEQIRAVAEYSPIEISGERFFDRAFTTGKEAAGSLGFAKRVGRWAVLADLMRLRASLMGAALA